MHIYNTQHVQSLTEAGYDVRTCSKHAKKFATSDSQSNVKNVCATMCFYMQNRSLSSIFMVNSQTDFCIVFYMYPL